MHLFENYIETDDKLSELDSLELRTTFGGDALSELIYIGMGYLFEKLDQAARRGAPRGNTYKHSG